MNLSGSPSKTSGTNLSWGLKMDNRQTIHVADIAMSEYFEGSNTVVTCMEMSNAVYIYLQLWELGPGPDYEFLKVSQLYIDAYNGITRCRGLSLTDDGDTLYAGMYDKLYTYSYTIDLSVVDSATGSLSAAYMPYYMEGSFPNWSFDGTYWLFATRSQVPNPDPILVSNTNPEDSCMAYTGVYTYHFTFPFLRWGPANLFDATSLLDQKVTNDMYHSVDLIPAITELTTPFAL